MARLPRARISRTAVSAAICIVCLSAPAAVGQSARTSPDARAGAAQTFADAFSAFAEQNELRRGLIVVRLGGGAVHQHAFGGIDAARPVHLASLSKMITGACAATLIRDGKLALGTTVQQALAASPMALDAASAEVGKATVAALLTHRSGLSGNRGDGEVSSGREMIRIITASGPGEASQPIIVRRILSSGLKRSAGEFQYSNDGYSLLGAVIAATDGRPYAAACRDRVLKPAGVEATLAPGWEFMGPFGGWSMTGNDVLKVLDAVLRDDALVGEAAGAWHRGGAGQAPGVGQPWYGLGLNTRATSGGGRNNWHWGAWQARYRRTGETEVAASFNAFAARMSDGTAWFAYFEPNLPPVKRNALDAMLADAWRRSR